MDRLAIGETALARHVKRAQVILRCTSPGDGMRDESLHGESAAVFSAHQKNGDFTTDAQIWISKSKGLVLREEEDMDVGGGASGKSHLSIRYEYSNVQAPLISQ